jgi:hypothetical protein
MVAAVIVIGMIGWYGQAPDQVGNAVGAPATRGRFR